MFHSLLDLLNCGSRVESKDGLVIRPGVTNSSLTSVGGKVFDNREEAVAAYLQESDPIETLWGTV